jgi:hypothetical protein
MKRRDILKGVVAAPFLALFGWLRPEEAKAEPEREIKEWYAWQEVCYPQIDPIVYTKDIEVHITKRIDNTWDIYFVFTHQTPNLYEQYRIQNMSWVIKGKDYPGFTIYPHQYEWINCHSFSVRKIVRLDNNVMIESIYGHKLRVELGDRLDA